MAPSTAPPDQDALVAKAQQGERPAFAVLVEAYWDRLYRWLYHVTHDRHTAEDLTQESFLKALGALDSFQVGTNFQAWLFRIAHNTLVNATRAGRRNKQAFPEQLPAFSQGPLELAMTREAMQHLTRAVGRLPHEFRAAFLLRVEEDLSFREIADVLGTTEDTARWRVFKARKKLLEVLSPHLEPEVS